MIFLRHPRPDIDQTVCYGRTDIGIHPEGHEQIKAAMISTPKVSRILASPAKRCRKLALSLAERDGIEAVFDERLWEMNMGDWEKLPWSEVHLREESKEWFKDPFLRPCPGGESFFQVQSRVLEALSEADEDCAIVCHAGPIRAVRMAWSGLSFREAFDEKPAWAEPVFIRRQARPDGLVRRPNRLVR